jgi:hypothetical protein
MKMNMIVMIGNEYPPPPDRQVSPHRNIIKEHI